MTSLHKLSLPKSIVSDLNDESFSADLLKQFDKRRSRLHFELGLLSQEPSKEESLTSTSSIHEVQAENTINQTKATKIESKIDRHELTELDTLINQSQSKKTRSIIQPSEPSNLDTPLQHTRQLRSTHTTETPEHHDYSHIEPIQLDHDTTEDEESQSIHQKRTSYASKRSSSANDLLRKSSAFLLSKLNMLKKKKSQEVPSPITSQSTSPTKLVMKTTISIPSTASNKHYQDTSNNTTLTTKSLPSGSQAWTAKSIKSQDMKKTDLEQLFGSSIPTLTQYPPKPLVYSPVEPMIDPSPSQKPLLHRLSMPLMRAVHNTSHEPIPRNRSVASLSNRRRKSEPESHSKRKIRK